MALRVMLWFGHIYYSAVLDMNEITQFNIGVHKVQGGSNMTGTNCDLFTHKSSRSYLNHLVQVSYCKQLVKLHFFILWFSGLFTFICLGRNIFHDLYFGKIQQTNTVSFVVSLSQFLLSFLQLYYIKLHKETAYCMGHAE